MWIVSSKIRAGCFVPEAVGGGENIANVGSACAPDESGSAMPDSRRSESVLLELPNRCIRPGVLGIGARAAWRSVVNPSTPSLVHRSIIARGSVGYRWEIKPRSTKRPTYLFKVAGLSPKADVCSPTPADVSFAKSSAPVQAVPTKMHQAPAADIAPACLFLPSNM